MSFKELFFCSFSHVARASGAEVDQETKAASAAASHAVPSGRS
jgi:hypothetical protein